jgi:hypothetical protein
MVYCAICGADHSPDSPCSGPVEKMLHDIEIESDSQMSGEEFKEIQKRVDRSCLKILLIMIVGFIFLLALVFVIQRYV